MSIKFNTIKHADFTLEEFDLFRGAVEEYGDLTLNQVMSKMDQGLVQAWFFTGPTGNRVVLLTLLRQDELYVMQSLGQGILRHMEYVLECLEAFAKLYSKKKVSAAIVPWMKSYAERKYDFKVSHYVITKEI